MNELYPMVPASSKLLWLLGPIILVMLIGLLFLGYTWYEAHHTAFEVSPEGLRIRRSVYARTIPAQALRADAARPIDLELERDYRPRWRTLGTGLPGYSAGWFRLRNREKALLFLTDRHNVVYIPTRAGYAILVSVPDPAGFIAALRRSAT